MASVTYSVWDEGAQRYDYYEAPGKLRAGVMAPDPTHLSTILGGSKLGVTPEEAARPLPAGARKVGSGMFPKGLIARRGGPGRALGAILGIDEKLLWVGAGGALVYLWLTRRR